jgi:hypothetical protein
MKVLQPQETILLIIYSITLLTLTTLFFTYVLVWSKRGKSDSVLAARNIDSMTLAHNFRSQIKLLFHLPNIFTPSKIYRLKDKITLLTYLSLTFIIVSVALIAMRLSKLETGDDSQSSTTLLVGFLGYFVFVNLFVAVRIYAHNSFEAEKLLKKAFANIESIRFLQIRDSARWSSATMTVNVQITPTVTTTSPEENEKQSPTLNEASFVSIVRPRQSLQVPHIKQGGYTSGLNCADPNITTEHSVPSPGLSNLTVGVVQKRTFLSRVTDLMTKYTLQPQFNHFDRTLLNYLRILVRIVEFFQLVSLPLRDLMKHPFFLSKQSTDSFLNSAVAFATTFVLTGLPKVDSEFLINMQFFTVFASTLLMLVLGLLGFLLTYFAGWESYQDSKWTTHTKADDKTPISLTEQSPANASSSSNDFSKLAGQGWLLYFGHIVEVIYLPFSHTYISLVKCLVDYNYTVGTSSDVGRCITVIHNPTWFTAFSLTGYAIGYIMMTFYLTSKPERPVDGEISYGSWAIVVLKNLSLLLVLNYSFFLPYPIARGVISAAILLLMFLYQSIVGSCFTWVVNHWRTASYVATLWTSLVVALITHQEWEWIYTWVEQSYYVIGGGWLVTFVVFLALQLWYRKR